MDRVRVQDVGTFDGEVIGFGGVHSNLHALLALIEVAGARPAICTGDVVAYCGDPAGSVAALRATGWPVVAGNCERQVAVSGEDCGCGFGAESACDLLSRGWYAHALAETGAEARSWMADLPDIVLFRAQGLRWAAIHGGVTRINRFLWPDSPEEDFAEEIEALSIFAGPVDAVLAGHAGIAFERRVGGVLWVNAGAIGMPPNDGRRATRYVVIGAEGVAIRRLDYDAEGAAQAMVGAGVTQGYERALLSGWWPSEDILPHALRRAARADGALLPMP